MHSEAASAQETDWPQIAELYRLLDGAEPNPMVTLNRAVAVAMADGPTAGLAMLDTVLTQLDRQHRLHAVRGHLLELSGEHDSARAAYDLAARLTTSLPEQRYLREKAESLAHERD